MVIHSCGSEGNSPDLCQGCLTIWNLELGTVNGFFSYNVPSCLMTTFDITLLSSFPQQSWLLVSRELISFLHLSLTHMTEDRMTVSQEVSIMKSTLSKEEGTRHSISLFFCIL